MRTVPALQSLHLIVAQLTVFRVLYAWAAVPLLPCATHTQNGSCGRFWQAGLTDRIVYGGSQLDPIGLKTCPQGTQKPNLDLLFCSGRFPRRGNVATAQSVSTRPVRSVLPPRERGKNYFRTFRRVFPADCLLGLPGAEIDGGDFEKSENERVPGWPPSSPWPDEVS